MTKILLFNIVRYIHGKIRLIFWLYAFTILVLSLLPQQSLPAFSFSLDLLQPDKIAHLILYFGATVLGLLAFGAVEQKYRRWLRIGGLLIIYGIVIELLQGCSPSRNFDLGDILANIIGVILGITAFPLFLRYYNGMPTKK
ncbi:MAG: VanZ family protein [Chitinophagales bacterium]